MGQIRVAAASVRKITPSLHAEFDLLRLHVSREHEPFLRLSARLAGTVGSAGSFPDRGDEGGFRLRQCGGLAGTWLRHGTREARKASHAETVARPARGEKA